MQLDVVMMVVNFYSVCRICVVGGLLVFEVIGVWIVVIF